MSDVITTEPPDDYEYATSVEGNIAIKRGHHAHGERNHTAKMNAAMVLRLRERYENGEVPAVMARELNLDRQTVVDAIRGTNWKHLPGAIPLRGERAWHKEQK